MRTSNIVIVLCLALPLAGCGSLFGGDGPRRGGMGGGLSDTSRSILEAYDLNHDGSVTRAELEAGLRADFAKADADHDGKLNEAEIAPVNAQRWSSDASSASPLVDWNNDGFVDFSEFAGTARSLFTQVDADGDGVLTPAEMKPQRIGPPAEPRREGGRRRQQRDGE